MLCKGHSPYSYRCICVRSVCSMASNTSQDTTERVVHFRKRKRGSRDVVGEPISANLAGNSPPLSHPLAVRQLQDTLVLQRARQKEHGVRASTLLQPLSDEPAAPPQNLDILREYSTPTMLYGSNSVENEAVHRVKEVFIEERLAVLRQQHELQRSQLVRFFVTKCLCVRPYMRNSHKKRRLVPSLENSLRIPTACTAVVAPPPLKITSKLLTL
uniref:Cytadherence high molecular weight protein 2 n=2 Tax=Lygus hesperus TaxID=30085 RepID=A0A0A9W1C9_LYGHE